MNKSIKNYKSQHFLPVIPKDTDFKPFKNNIVPVCLVRVQTRLSRDPLQAVDRPNRVWAIFEVEINNFENLFGRSDSAKRLDDEGIVQSGVGKRRLVVHLRFEVARRGYMKFQGLDAG